MCDQTLTLKFSTQAEYTHKVFDIVEKLLDIARLREEDRHAFIIALGEALDNAVAHGNKMDKKKYIEIECASTKNRIVCSIKDSGSGFNHQSILSRPVEEFNPRKLLQKAGQGRLRGLGLTLIRKCVDELSFNKEGNKITFAKYLVSLPEKDLVNTF